MNGVWIFPRWRLQDTLGFLLETVPDLPLQAVGNLQELGEGWKKLSKRERAEGSWEGLDELWWQGACTGEQPCWRGRGKESAG